MEKNKIVLGILAHVDAGKTTLSESILYTSGSIRKLGRVDHKNAFLDTHEIEQERGITIFSKQAQFQLENNEYTLLDTPGHIDFSTEMERTLQVLDYAVLVINGCDGIQGHTMTLWKLLRKYKIPAFIFVNKMDATNLSKDELISNIQNKLSSNCIVFSKENNDEFYDNIAMTEEALMDEYLSEGEIAVKSIQGAIKNSSIFPVFWGSALKLEGIEELLKAIDQYSILNQAKAEFGAKVYKISRDSQGNRLTHIKITSGSLKVKDEITKSKDGKIDQIRIYSGDQYQTVDNAGSGTICAVLGLTDSFIGQGMGIEEDFYEYSLQPVLKYKLFLPEDINVFEALQKLKLLEEESPQLNLVWDEVNKEIQVQVMGEIEIEILSKLILDRFGFGVEFGEGSILYKETIQNTVEGIGHFEPLKHYAEVHLLLEPGAQGSGVITQIQCSEDLLDKNWQNLVISHLKEQPPKGVLTGSDVTDIKITLVSGKAHNKHTEGGDFRQATFRALRQGLKKARSIVLEPVYEFELEVPKESIGRAMSDIQKMYGEFSEPFIDGDIARLKGKGPVATMNDYHREVAGYTKGYGRFYCSFEGYEPCHNEEEIINKFDYDSEKDVEHPTGSVFCVHGAGFGVPWNQVEEYMHLPSFYHMKEEKKVMSQNQVRENKSNRSITATDKELEEIFVRTYGEVKSHRLTEARKKSFDQSKEVVYKPKKHVVKEKFLLVDGYNIIYAWDELKELAQENLEAARTKLLDELCSYQSYKNITVIVVFDAYRVKNGTPKIYMYQNIKVVFTKEAETADQYIEKSVYDMVEKYDVKVATSDALEQMIILGKGAERVSARGFLEEIKEMDKEIEEKFLNKGESLKNRPFQN